jgi:hypothetical protein
VAFSVADLLQEQWRALSLPQEHLAWAAQTQPAPALVLQQVEAGWTILKIGGDLWLVGGWLIVEIKIGEACSSRLKINEIEEWFVSVVKCSREDCLECRMRMEKEK